MTMRRIPAGLARIGQQAQRGEQGLQKEVEILRLHQKPQVDQGTMGHLGFCRTCSVMSDGHQQDFCSERLAAEMTMAMASDG